MPKNVLIELRLVTDRQTDRRTQRHSFAVAQLRAVKNIFDSNTNNKVFSVLFFPLIVHP